MRKCFILFITLLVSAPLWAQSDDDVYYVPKKAVKTEQPAATFYVGSDRDVDEYNRHRALVSEVEEMDVDDVFAFEQGNGVYPEGEYEGEADEVYAEDDDDDYYDEPYDDDDYYYSRELGRWYDCWCPYAWRWYSPFYSPWYVGSWGWYDPWYWGYWGAWYSSWYYPVYLGGWGWHSGSHHLGAMAHGHGVGLTNRRGGTLASTGTTATTLGKRTGGNVYNNIARRSSTTSSASRVSSTSRSFSGVSTPSSAGARSYTPSTSSMRSSGSTISSGTRSGSFGGGARSGSFGGGARGGGGRR